MSDTPAPAALGGLSAEESEKLQEAFKEIATRSQKLLQDFSQRYQSDGQPVDPLHLTQTFMDFTAKMLADPNRLVQAQVELWQQYMKLWQVTAQRMMGQTVEPVAEPARGDKRFNDPAWKDEVVFDYLKQSYLLTARWLQGTIKQVEGVDEKTARKVDFYTRQFIDAVSPSNFAMTNPQVVKATVESKGENLLKGLQNLLADLERGKGQLAIRQTDMNAFKVGENIATTPGKVVYQNDIMQLIQYAPATEEVHEVPLLIVPPWINKFYILDLKPENSFIKWATEQGYTVFVISWVNPDEHLTKMVFEDYMKLGPLAALDAIAKATGQPKASAIGYCIGGTLMAATLAYMAARNDDRIVACTFFTAQVDFSEPGELGVFIDEDQLASVEEMMSKKGYLEGSEMATTFNMLRANDLIWSFVVNNYLMGKDPFPFDLLYWNADATRMPAAMHSYYLRNMYQKNLLSQPGGIVVDNVPIDLRKVKIPVYIQAGKEDHIAPSRSVYKATQIYGGPVRFMLAGSGHIAGVVNPPRNKKYQHWLNETAKNPPTLAEWQAGAKEFPGSWWHDWDKWLSALSGPKAPARVPGAGGLPAIEDAPGSYVKVRSGG
ncbi:class I poly(R)-hydroxyalkanoic acid synthase [Reyranella sp.]|uniref:PHA/PHB synthase family protein n=1 Tax=Reyranella sp. TaxID=1929291 RepID=UPI000BCE736F|nr:class I poly(R)-hydroxyalkanoic acid synthase [Reyranella sp.]OYY44159.1 MAG: class I poly(R)-hydroxyalkanoic acid synthase [Rhodospirillales bacterium 35-66-84]OYZ94835.1 MAG: class I poly(R)-hydroxyalkanoic acid synthase [Rhodospirillales bacterium 24-66-33]OZB26090.1 MAG: class I poly(R)-hydroxyalkanoic acid synthase [Rhodospirillales bacterium 39-66-50]HQS15213.1 class I poly(R)-hydroxyalkanoic acid synthase [Reyranella sp.]HQT11022.1 class I poly(R)-hydroxyalkanoic acid synthase [Reyra